MRTLGSIRALPRGEPAREGARDANPSPLYRCRHEARGAVEFGLMPVVARIDARRVVIFPHDHEPPHVHVFSAEATAVVNLNCPAGPPSLRSQRDYTTGEVSRILSALEPFVELLCAAWDRIYADR